MKKIVRNILFLVVIINTCNQSSSFQLNNPSLREALKKFNENLSVEKVLRYKRDIKGILERTKNAVNVNLPSSLNNPSLKETLKKFNKNLSAEKVQRFKRGIKEILQITKNAVNVNLPDVSLPSLPSPSLPKLSLPGPSLPSVSLPNIHADLPIGNININRKKREIVETNNKSREKRQTSPDLISRNHLGQGGPFQGQRGPFQSRGPF